MAGPRYDTVRDRCYPSTERIAFTPDCSRGVGQPCSLATLVREGPDPIRLAQVKDVIETVVSGRKYEVLLMRSQGKSFAEIAILLSVSKNTVQSYYRSALQRVRQALGYAYPHSAVKSPAASSLV